MIRTTSPLGALIALGLTAWLASCGEDATETCVGGTTRLCAGVGRCEGVQACLSDGSGYGECDCTGALRQPSNGDDSETGVTPIVGRSCASNDDCGEGLTCLGPDSSDFFGSGAPGGYCTAPCSADAQCAEIDGQSECVGDGNAGLCARTCLSKDPVNLAENKCLGRRDVACFSTAVLGVEEFSSFSRQDGWCLPQCGSNDDCAGRTCNLATGLCVDAAPAGAQLGEPCDRDVDCSGGICAAVSETDRFCSAPCVFGQPVGCGYGLNAQPRDAACFTPRVRGFLASEGDGDVGLCIELCDVDSDCTQFAASGWVCSISDGSLARFGRGVCLAPSPTDAGTDAGDAAGNVPDGGVSTGDASAASDAAG